jgi:hypothetical protein
MDERPLIGLTGFKGSGKDTVAGMLMRGFDYHQVAFADSLKIEVSEVSGASRAYLEEHKRRGPEHPKGWVRMLLQAWGQMRRDMCGEDYWIRQVPLRSGFVVSDVRYPNEAQAIKRAGGYLVHISREGCTSDGHSSEQVLDQWIDCAITNNGTVDDLVGAVRGLMSHIKIEQEQLA